MKHALYQITKNIPPPAVCIRSKGNGISALVRSLKKGDSVLIPFKQVQAAKQAGRQAGIETVWQRVGRGDSARIWHVGWTEQAKKETVRKFTRRHAILTAKMPRAAKVE